MMSSVLVIQLFLLVASSHLFESAATEDVPVSEIKRVILCDLFDVVLKCPPNTLITVHSAFYGRTNNDFCDSGPRHTYNCNSGPRALNVASAKCNHRQSCFLTGAMFGDPCFGTYKYLDLRYSCRALETAIACDDEVLRIQCPAGRYIRVRDGFFGRTSDEHCARGPRTDYTCSHPDFKRIAIERCDNQNACAFQSTSIPSDPCVGTFKHMTVAYECLDHQLAVVCDGQRTTITCPPGRSITVLDGFVGRRSDEYCAFGPRHTYECSAPNAHQAAISICHKKQSCIFAGLPVPDPCPNTLKYSIIKYRCD